VKKIKSGVKRKKAENHNDVDFSLFVARQGLEPRHTDPESVVLPLYYRAIMGSKNKDFLLNLPEQSDFSYLFDCQLLYRAL
jgi:hypothetical protein